MSDRSGARLGIICGLLASAGCSGPLYATTTSHGQTSSRTASAGSGGSSGLTAGTGASGTGSNTGGDTGTSSGTAGRPPGCPGACNLPGQFCDDAGECVVCLGDQQCTAPQSHCYLDAGPFYGTCNACLASSDCTPGAVCDSTLNCIPGCVQTQSCTGATPICEPDSGVCVTCLSAAECVNGLVCRRGACTICQSSFECSQNYVGLRICSPEENCVQCQVDEDCAAGQHCIGSGCK